MPRLQVARIETATRAEGPGLRWAIWVQGCSIGCAGCCNPHTWDPGADDGMDVAGLVERMLEAHVEGITLLGGEPFDQALPLAELADAAQRGGLGVMTFTGYRHETLRQGDHPGWRDLLDATDLLIDGPYLRSFPDTRRPWVGSTNQRFLHLSDRYRTYNFDSEPDRVEVRIRADGSVAVNGWPDEALIASIENVLLGDLAPVQEDQPVRAVRHSDPSVET